MRVIPTALQTFSTGWSDIFPERTTTSSFRRDDRTDATRDLDSSRKVCVNDVVTCSPVLDVLKLRINSTNAPPNPRRRRLRLSCSVHYDRRTLFSIEKSPVDIAFAPGNRVVTGIQIRRRNKLKPANLNVPVRSRLQFANCALHAILYSVHAHKLTAVSAKS